jgi:hypothetical protein
LADNICVEPFVSSGSAKGDRARTRPQPASSIEKMCLHEVPMARGPAHFLRNDARRAIRSAREAGLEPAGLDVIISKDGTTTFRVHGASSQQLAQAPGASAWNEATEQLKRKSKR